MDDALLLDGTSLSRIIQADLKERTTRLRGHGIIPKLAVLVAAQDPSSQAYVGMKRRRADEIGIASDTYGIDDTVSQNRVIEIIEELNVDPSVHGILIQVPLPTHLHQGSLIDALNPEKDVDGITPRSIGRMASGLKGFRCATPLGIIRLLDHYKIPIESKHALVIGAGVILGKPAALMLLERHATVTIAHKKTVNVPELCREADILVAATGCPELVHGDMLKPGVVVIDAGYRKIEGRKGGVGDVHYESARRVASAITPVPGGVGPMTVISLLSNVVDAAEARLAKLI